MLTQKEFLSQAKAGDLNALWTAVENHTVESQTELVATVAALTKEKEGAAFEKRQAVEAAEEKFGSELSAAAAAHAEAAATLQATIASLTKERDDAVAALHAVDPELKIAALKERKARVLAEAKEEAAKLDAEIKAIEAPAGA